MKSFQTYIKCIAAITTFAVLTACGGGGGGSTPEVIASTAAFPLKTVWVNSLTNTSSNNFNVTGTINNVSITGSGTVTFGALSAGTFAGLSAQQRTTTSTGSVLVNGTTNPINGSSISWVDSNYTPLGESGGTDYVLVTGTPNIPTTAHVYDTGTLYTANRYSDSGRNLLRGTKTVTYVLEADTATTALVTIIEEEKDTSSTLTSTSSSQFRITTTGTFTRIKETLLLTGVSITYTYR